MMQPEAGDTAPENGPGSDAGANATDLLAERVQAEFFPNNTPVWDAWWESCSTLIQRVVPDSTRSRLGRRGDRDAATRFLLQRDANLVVR